MSRIHSTVAPDKKKKLEKRASMSVRGEKRLGGKGEDLIRPTPRRLVVLTRKRGKGLFSNGVEGKKKGGVYKEKKKRVISGGWNLL